MVLIILWKTFCNKAVRKALEPNYINEPEVTIWNVNTNELKYENKTKLFDTIRDNIKQ